MYKQLIYLGTTNSDSTIMTTATDPATDSLTTATEPATDSLTIVTDPATESSTTARDLGKVFTEAAHFHQYLT